MGSAWNAYQPLANANAFVLHVLSHASAENLEELSNAKNGVGDDNEK